MYSLNIYAYNALETFSLVGWIPVHVFITVLCFSSSLCTRLHHLNLSSLFIIIYTYRQGTLIYDQGTLIYEQGTLIYVQGTLIYDQGTLIYVQGTLIFDQGTLAIINIRIDYKDVKPNCVSLKSCSCVLVYLFVGKTIRFAWIWIPSSCFLCALVESRVKIYRKPKGSIKKFCEIWPYFTYVKQWCNGASI